MKQGKKAVFAAGVLAAALSLTACGGGNDDAANDSATEASGGEQYDIALVSKGFQHQFWQAVNQGAQDKGEELGAEITFNGPASETEVASQLQMLGAAIERDPDAIGYAALDPQACIPLMEQAEAAGIPVIQFDAGCDSEYPLSIVKTNSYDAGALAAEHMAELIGGEGQIGIVAHSQINSTGVERRDGFVDYLAENHPEIEIADIQYGDGDHLKSADIAKAMIAAHDLKGLYGTNEGSAIGIVNAVNELGMEPGEITIVGFDSGQAQIDAIKSGVMAGAITQDPASIGAKTVELAVKAIEGEEVPESVDTPIYWYDAENIEDADIAPLLYK